MSAFDNLLRAHNPITNYSINADSNIGFELGAYGAGLELMAEELTVLEQEAFIPTAENFGLSSWERLWGAKRDDLTAEKRREMLLARTAFGYEDFTLEGMKKVLRFLGIEGVISEYPSVYRAVVEVADNLSEGKRNWVSAQLRAVFPAHIEVDAVFAGFDWDSVESRNLTFDSMEQKAMCWSEIDIYVM